MDLRNRIKLLTARTTPISEPGRDIEDKLEEIRELMPYILAGRLEFVETVRKNIRQLRQEYDGNNNYAVSNRMAKGVADRAEELLEELIVAGSKRGRTLRKTRKTRKNSKNKSRRR